MSFDLGAVVDLAMPAAQAVATVSILKYQKGLYDDIANKRIEKIEEAVAKFEKSIEAQIKSGRFRDAFGTKPKAVLFKQVDTAALGKKSAEDSLNAVPAAQRYLNAANRIMEQDSIVRALMFDGRYVCVEDVVSCTISDLINGHLPVGDVLEIIKDNAERAAMNGRIGNTHDMTMLDLGISRLRAQTSGMNAHFAHLQSLNQNVHRVGDRVAISDFMQKPEQRLGLALAQAQLIQQSLQNEANIKAAGDPQSMALLQARIQEATMVLGMEGQKGNMINQFVPNYAALLAPSIESISQALIGRGTSEYSATSSSTQQPVSTPPPAPTVDQRSTK
jgi:hypothetical protein